MISWFARALSNSCHNKPHTVICGHFLTHYWIWMELAIWGMCQAWAVVKTPFVQRVVQQRHAKGLGLLVLYCTLFKNIGSLSCGELVKGRYQLVTASSCINSITYNFSKQYLWNDLFPIWASVLCCAVLCCAVLCYKHCAISTVLCCSLNKIITDGYSIVRKNAQSRKLKH